MGGGVISKDAVKIVRLEIEIPSRVSTVNLIQNLTSHQIIRNFV
jgi:hypothetical protein